MGVPSPHGRYASLRPFCLEVPHMFLALHKIEGVLTGDISCQSRFVDDVDVEVFVSHFNVKILFATRNAGHSWAPQREIVCVCVYIGLFLYLVAAMRVYVYIHMLV